jgi:hypothetical protein
MKENIVFAIIYLLIRKYSQNKKQRYKEFILLLKYIYNGKYFIEICTKDLDLE